MIKWSVYVLLESLSNMTKPMRQRFYFLTLRLIKTKKDYQAALARLEVVTAMQQYAIKCYPGSIPTGSPCSAYRDFVKNDIC